MAIYGNTCYFGDIHIGFSNAIIPSNEAGYMLNKKVLKVLTFQYRGLRYFDKNNGKVLWI